MTKKVVNRVLTHEEQLEAIIRRMKRANGQMSGVVRMLQEGRECEEVIQQMAAVGKAINTAAFSLISASLKECIEKDEKECAEIIGKLQKLFLSLA